MRFIDEQSYEYISETLNLPLGTVKANIHKRIKHTTKRVLIFSQVEDLLLACPDLDSKLNNGYDVDYIGFDEALRQATNAYCNLHFMECLNLIGNDYFYPEDTHLLLKKFTHITGINCIYDPDRDIHVMLNKNDIIVTNKEFVKDFL